MHARGMHERTRVRRTRTHVRTNTRTRPRMHIRMCRNAKSMTTLKRNRRHTWGIGMLEWSYLLLGFLNTQHNLPPLPVPTQAAYTRRVRWPYVARGTLARLRVRVCIRTCAHASVSVNVRTYVRTRVQTLHGEGGGAGGTATHASTHAQSRRHAGRRRRRRGPARSRHCTSAGSTQPELPHVCACGRLHGGAHMWKECWIDTDEYPGLSPA